MSVTISSGLKAELLSLQSMQKLYDQTEERLTSGYKVSSSSDDVSAYATSQTLYNQASALEGRIDGMEQAVSAISAADDGIESMVSVLSSMTAIVESAIATDSDDTDTRAALGEKFNNLLIQLSSLADDSEYNGTNLLLGDTISVQTGVDYNDSTIEVDGFYVAGGTDTETDENGEIGSADSGSVPSSWGSGAAEVTNYAFALNEVGDESSVLGVYSYGKSTLTTEAEAANSAIDSIQEAVATAISAAEAYGETVDSTSDPTDTLSEIDTQIAAALEAANVSVTDDDGNTTYLFATSDTTTAPFTDSDGDGLYEYEGVEYDGSTSTGNESVDAILETLNSLSSLRDSVSTATTSTDIDTSTLTADAEALDDADVIDDFGIDEYETEADAWEVDWTDEDNYSDILSEILDQIEALQDVLESRSTQLAFSESIITAREDYTEQMVETLEDAGDDLVLADLTTESANLLALETSESLAVNAMSLSNEQTQSLLRLLS